MSEMKSLTIGNNTYEVVDAVARENGNNNGDIDIPKIYKWEKYKKELDSYNTGTSQTYSGSFRNLVNSNEYAVKGYKTAIDAFLRPSGVDFYNYVGKSFNSDYPYVYFSSMYPYDGQASWTSGVYKITAISVTMTETSDVTYEYKYTYNYTGQLLTTPVYSDNLIGYKYGLSEEYAQLFPTSTDISYVLTNPD